MIWKENTIMVENWLQMCQYLDYEIIYVSSCELYFKIDGYKKKLDWTCYGVKIMTYI